MMLSRLCVNVLDDDGEGMKAGFAYRRGGKRRWGEGR